VIRAGFKLIRPTADTSTYLNLWWNLWDDRYVESFMALNTWANDYIAPPACVRALMDAVGSTDKEYIELPGGHISLIAGRSALHTCWPRVSSWLAARSNQTACHAAASSGKSTDSKYGATASHHRRRR
jgi:poly(3-hydroxyalkanoate) synthetase